MVKPAGNPQVSEIPETPTSININSDSGPLFESSTQIKCKDSPLTGKTHCEIVTRDHLPLLTGDRSTFDFYGEARTDQTTGFTSRGFVLSISIDLKTRDREPISLLRDEHATAPQESSANQEPHLNFLTEFNAAIEAGNTDLKSSSASKYPFSLSLGSRFYLDEPAQQEPKKPKTETSRECETTSLSSGEECVSTTRTFSDPFSMPYSGINSINLF